MFALAILVGIYSYLIFTLGILGQLYKINILVLAAVFVILSVYYFKKEYKTFKKPQINLDNTSKIFLTAIVCFSIVNLVGAVGPELSFDALWYHLTIPKIFLTEHRIFHISGGLFYYSDMPKLTEMLYVLPLSFGNEILAKLIHFSFGLLSLGALYRVSRKFFNTKLSLLAVLVFASNLVFAWESTTAYVDLSWTFFEIMAFWGFLNWREKKERKWLIEFSVMLGLGICSKLIGAGGIIVFAGLMLYGSKSNFKNAIKPILTMTATALLVASPWFVYSLIHTGNPIYPLFTNFYTSIINLSIFNPVNIIKSFYNLFLHLSDPISPFYLIILPLVVLWFKKFERSGKILSIYALLSIIVWYLTPQTGGGRFILPYLPVFSILAVYVISIQRNLLLKKYLFGLVIVIALTTLVYRGAANLKFVPVVLGFESKQDFLTDHLNFGYGDFLDTDDYFKNNIKEGDKVLLYGFHNLYYADFPFIDSSYANKGDKFNYIATQNTTLPKRFSYWQLIYENPITLVKLYSFGGMMWQY